MFRRAGAVRPVVPGAIYAGFAIATDAMIAFAPENAWVALVAVILWLAASLFLFIVVTWFRHDDWLEAGVIIGLSAVLGGALARAVSIGIAERSIGALLLLLTTNPGMFLILLLNLLVMVPLSGGAVALARIVKQPPPGAEPPVEAPKRSRKFRYGGGP